MTQSPVKTANRLAGYQAGFQQVRRERETDGPGWLVDLGDQAWSSFGQLGFPTARRGNERWKYTNVAAIANTNFGNRQTKGSATPSLGDLLHSAPWNDDWTNLVFLDGRFAPAMSNVDGFPVNGTLGAGGAKKITACSLTHAISSGGFPVEQYQSRLADFRDDGFTALNTALFADGAFISVPEGYSGGAPLHLIYINTNDEQPVASFPRTMIVTGENSEASIIESYVGPQGAQYFTDAVTDIDLGSGSVLDYYRLLIEGGDAYHIGVTRVTQGRDSRFSSSSLAMGTTLTRNELSVLLDNSGASCHLNGLYLTADGQHIDNLINIDHAQPYTSSRLNFKGILDGKSRAVFGGEVLVRKDAQKVDAQQTDKNLLLSPDAEVDSKPSLLIYADDVQCAHGATAGNIDEESLFYLKSRGLAPDIANRMLVHAFAREIIETVRIEPLKDHLDQLVLEAIPVSSSAPGGIR